MADLQTDTDAGAVKPPIIMKVDEPPEDKKKEGTGESDKTRDKVLEIKPSQVCSPTMKPILSSSRLGNPFAMHSASPSNSKSNSSSVLRPSQLSLNAGMNNPKLFSLNPSRLDPFAKVFTSNEGHSSLDKKQCSNKTEINGETPKFVPLLVSSSKDNEVSNKVSSNVASSNMSTAFVFGQNIQDRVVTDGGAEEPRPSTSYTNSNGTSDMLFSSAVKEKVDSTKNNSKESKSLSESAREYEESRANKRKYEEVEVTTGEEQETNVAQISCKLFAFDKASGNWQERGRGTLRLNDREMFDGDSTYKQSRLVFRTSGSLRVVLNTKIWADMTIEQASCKSIRLTALDGNGEIKVFLIMGNQDEMKLLYKHLEERVTYENDRQKFGNTKEQFSNPNNSKRRATDSGGD